MKHLFVPCLSLLTILFGSSLTFADETATENIPVVFVSEFVDPAFEQYIDVSLIGQAWETQDASLLTDAAMQLAVGEKKLLRNHRAFSSRELLDKALTIAADRKDLATLDRLEKVARATDNQSFAAQVAATKKLAAESRALTPNDELLQSITSPEAQEYFATLSELISRLRTAGDAKTLENVEMNIKTEPALKEKLSTEAIDALTKLAGESRAALGDIPQEELQLGFALEKLAGESRQAPPYGYSPYGGPRPGGPRPTGTFPGPVGGANPFGKGGSKPGQGGGGQDGQSAGGQFGQGGGKPGQGGGGQYGQSAGGQFGQGGGKPGQGGGGQYGQMGPPGPWNGPYPPGGAYPRPEQWPQQRPSDGVIITQGVLRIVDNLTRPR